MAAELPKQEQINADETATKEENRKAWPWTFVVQKFTVFRVRSTREASAVEELLTDDVRGIVSCDWAERC